ncbi:MAG: hypothetical protein GWP06_17735 [Actinobacteria bacterium]|nr:hypothetical protein [Actinomycetota bacterium]
MASFRNSVFFSKRLFIFWIVLIILLALEGFFDIFEVVMGKYLLLTNPLRPRIGRLWVEESKDQEGLKEMSAVQTELPQDSLYSGQLNSLEDIRAVLSIKNSISLSKDRFLQFYKLNEKQAQKIIDPLVLYDLERGDQWTRVRMTLNENQIGIFFLNGYGQPITESFLSLSSAKPSEHLAASKLEQDPEFKERIVPAGTFFTAFDQLSRFHRLQIINDPYKLIQWMDSLRRVGISAHSSEGSVELAFEVQMGETLTIHRLTASEIAAGYLIAAINRSGYSPKLALPVPGEVSNE